MVGSRYNPVIAGGKGRPLNVDDQPGQAMAAQTARRVVGRVQVYDGKSLGAIGGQQLESKAAAA